MTRPLHRGRNSVTSTEVNELQLTREKTRPSSLSSPKGGGDSSEPGRAKPSSQFRPALLLCICTLTLFLLLLFLLLLVSSRFGLWLGLGSIPNPALLRPSLQQQLLSEFSDGGIFGLGVVRPRGLQTCPDDMAHTVPALIRKGGSGNNNLCLIRPPQEYHIPLRWPASRDCVWNRNLKFPSPSESSSSSSALSSALSSSLASSSSSSSSSALSGIAAKRLMLLEEKLIAINPGHGIKTYSQQIAKMIGLNSDGQFHQAGVQTVLDIGCGFNSLSAHLISRRVTTLCVAQYEEEEAHGSQVQFALERGLPAMIASFVVRQLPYPALSFDMVHCSDCGIDWNSKDGSLLIEVDRLLRPSGYFVWTLPAQNSGVNLPNAQDEKKLQKVADLAKRMCWDLLSREGQTVVWKKKNEQTCYIQRGSKTLPGLCNMDGDRVSRWNEPLHLCIVGVPNARWISAQRKTLWPNVLTLPSSRLVSQGFFSKELTEDSSIWLSIVKNYWTLFSPLLFSDHPKRPTEDDPLPPSNMVRNVMDMNAAYGSFNWALLQAGKSVWVMNVVPTSGPNTLPAIFSRGLIGALHDWCEAFPTYPRTYDLLHGIGLLSKETERPRGCGLSNLFLEMDRILRPEGWVLLRDKAPLIEDARVAALQMRWDVRIVGVDTDNDSMRLLVCQKSFWKS